MNQISMHKQQEVQKSDKFVLMILLAHLPFTMFLVPWGHGTGTMEFAIVASLVVAAIFGLGYFLARGTRLFSVLAAVSLMLFSVIMIQAQLGRIEMHFHIFVAIAFLMIYRDWLPVLVAAGTIAVHHLLFTGLQLSGVSVGEMPIMIYNYGCSWGIAILHAVYVVIEAVVVVIYAMRMNREQQVSFAIIDAVHDVAQGKNMQTRIPVYENDPTVKSFNGMVEQFASMLAEINTSVTSLTASAANLGTLSDNAHRLLHGQMQESQQAATATTEMSATIHDVARNAAQAAQSANEVDEQVQQGNRLVDTAAKSTDELNRVLGGAASSIANLEQNVQKISSVVDVIQNISGQTNLLALNAAIEAARAGEQGRGFAVVADEVRTLAQRTSESTREIQAMIEALQSGTAQVVSAMGQGQEQSGRTNQHIKEAGVALSAIAQAIDTVSKMNDQIATAAEEQSVASDHINQNVQLISSQNEEVVRDADEVKAAALGLNQLAQRLANLVKQYRV